MACHIEYSADLFDRETVENLACRFVTLAAAVIAAPDEPLGSVAGLSAWERDALTSCAGANRIALPVAQRLDDMAHACSPQAAILTHDARSLTFGDLDLLAGRIASGLAAAGLAGSRIAVAMEPSAEMLGCFFGIWRAGGVCIPLNIRDAVARHDFILADSGARALLVESPPSGRKPSFDGMVIPWADLFLRGTAASWEQDNAVACVVYARGNGIEVTHAALAAAGVARATGLSGMKTLPLRIVEASDLLFASAWALAVGGELVLSVGDHSNDEIGWSELCAWGVVPDGSAVDIGGFFAARPLPGIECEILDGEGALLPMGCWGDLWIGGLPSPIFNTGRRARWSGGGRLLLAGGTGEKPTLDIMARPSGDPDAPSGSSVHDLDFVREIWSKVLGGDVDDVDSQFFDCGGSSMKLLELRMAFARAGCEVGVMDLFRHSTIRQQARFLAESRREQVAPESAQAPHRDHAKSRLAMQRSKRKSTPPSLDR